MSISSCPKCGDEVRIPAGASSNAQVQCPLCREEYELSAALIKLPPSLVVLSDPGGNGETSGYGFGQAAAPAGDAPAFQFDPSATPTSPGPSAPTPSLQGGPPRRQRRQKSMLRQMIPIVLGGAMAFPLAQMAMWYMPWPWEFDRDPVRISPKVAQFVPWIVPEKYHGNKPSDEGTDKESPKTSKGKSAKTDDSDNGFKATSTQGTPLGDSRSVPFGKSNADGNKNEFSALDENPNKSTTNFDEPASFRDAPFHAASDMERAIDEYLTSAGAWAGSVNLGAAEKAKANHDFYASIARLGEVATYVDHEDIEIQTSLTDMDAKLRNLAGDDARFEFLASQASDWMANPKQRTNGGFLLAGTVISVEKKGSVYESVVELKSRIKPRIPVVQFDKPDQKYVPGASVLMLGAVVAEPSKNLIGYKGSATELNIGRHSITMALSAPPVKKPTTDSGGITPPNINIAPPSLPIQPATDLLNDKKDE